MYKSDLIEAIHTNNKEIIAEMRLVENKLENKLESKISELERKVDAKLDKMHYFLFTIHASSIASLVGFVFHSLH